MGKFKMTEFAGSVEVLGVERSFEFGGSSLTISGLSAEDAQAVMLAISQNDAGASPVEFKVSLPSQTNGNGNGYKATNGHKDKDEGSVISLGDGIKIIKATKETIQPDKLVDKFVAAEPSVPFPPGLEQAKSLRDVVGILFDQTKNPDELVKLCSSLREKVPALRAVDPANLDARVRRAAVVLTGDQ